MKLVNKFFKRSRWLSDGGESINTEGVATIGVYTAIDNLMSYGRLLTSKAHLVWALFLKRYQIAVLAIQPACFF